MIEREAVFCEADKKILEKLESDESMNNYILEKPFDKSDTSQTFYKIFSRHIDQQTIMKHGYKLFELDSHQVDLGMFCLSLLQFEAKFPARIFSNKMIKIKEFSENTEEMQKIIWIETQFLVESTTDSGEFENKELEFERKVNKFFIEELVPLLQQFKNKKICWENMTDPQFLDESVVKEFKDQIIPQLNQRFKAVCK